MTVTHNGADHKIGECVMDAQNITCTFNDTLDTLRGQGFNGLNGKGSALVVASEATEDSTATIDANGQKTAVPIPGGRITENRGLNYTPETLRKWAFDVTAASKQMDWEITLGPSQLKDALAGAGTPIALDGQTRSTITITDELSPGQAYSQDLSQWRFNIGTSSTRDDVYGQVTDAAGNDQDTSQGDFDLAVAIDGNRATITITGPFAADTNYNVYYSSVPTSDSGTVQPGLEYKNHAQLKGTDQDSSWSVYYTRSFTIDVELAPGFGGFNIAKLLAGSGAPKVPAGTTFDVGIDYTLPGGATVDTYPGWSAPGTVNADRTGGHTTLKVTSGDTTTYPATFPTGTVLTLSEDTSTASTTPERGRVIPGTRSTCTGLRARDAGTTRISMTRGTSHGPRRARSVKSSAPSPNGTHRCSTQACQGSGAPWRSSRFRTIWRSSTSTTRRTFSASACVSAMSSSGTSR